MLHDTAARAVMTKTETSPAVPAPSKLPRPKTAAPNQQKDTNHTMTVRTPSKEGNDHFAGGFEPVTMRSARIAPVPYAAGSVLTRLMSGRASAMSFLEEKRVAEEVVVVVSTVISTATSTCGRQERVLTEIRSRDEVQGCA